MTDVKVGEVCTQRLRCEPDAGEKPQESTSQWMEIKEGVFAAPRNGGSVPCRVTYAKPETNIVTVTVDARPSSPLPTDREDPNDGFFQANFQVVPASSVVDCTLSIDLGNTRTVALLVDHVGEPVADGRLPVYPLPIYWSQCPASESTGVFESVVSFVCPDSDAAGFCGDESRLSFAKLGKFAIWNNRAFSSEDRSHGRYTLSSPKRYFWDGDAARRDWIGIRYCQQELDMTQACRPLDGRLARQLGADARTDACRLPPASILSAMVAELYEQACHYVGSPGFKTLTGDDSLRRLSKVHVTYPSTLLPREREVYQRQLREGISAYLHDFAADPVELSSEIDEASSVLSVYAYSEMRKSSALFWLQSIGRKSPLGYQARIAVVDVGGGTTDLSISSVEAFAEDAGVDPFKARIDLVCRDGVNQAGDALMFDFIRNCVARLGLDSLWEATQVGEGALTKEVLLERYRSSDNEALVRELTRNFWFDLAVRVAAECDEALRRYPDGDVGDDDFQTLGYSLTEGALATWRRLFGKGIDIPEQIEVKVTREVFEQYEKSVSRTFQTVARSFAAAIGAYDVDVLLFSGKTAEFLAVQNAFKKVIALPESSIRSMKNFEVGTWCGSLTDLQGRIADSKVSTALGGALYSLRTDSSVNLIFDGHVADLPCKWGFVLENGPLAFAHPIFNEGELQKDVKLGAFRKLIARRPPFSRTAILSYELRFRPGVIDGHGGLQGDATVRLSCNMPRQEITIVGCQGQYKDFTEVRVEDLECRICTMNGEFAMDKVVEIK